MSSNSVNISRFSLLCVVLGMAGCAVLPGARQEPGQRFTGDLSLASGQLRLRPCDSEMTVVVADLGNIQQLFERAAQPDRPTQFVDMTARVLPGGELQPLEVIRLQTGGNGCAEQAHARSQWMAVGDGRKWQAQISPAGMQWQDDTQGSSAVAVPFITEDVPGSAISFQTLRGNTQELWIYPQGCFEPSSGDYFHRTARFMRHAETLTGCAYRGLLP